MNFLIDESIKEILELGVDEFEKFVPKTVADALAIKLLKTALSEDGIKALQIVADRSSGRPTVAKVEAERFSPFAEAMNKLLGENNV